MSLFDRWIFFWANLRIRRKFAYAGLSIIGLFLLLSIFSLIFATQQQQLLEERAFLAVDIQRLALDSDRQFRQAIVLQRDFFALYPVEGLTQAQTQYALPAIDLMKDVESAGNELNEIFEDEQSIQFDIAALSTYQEVVSSNRNSFTKAASFVIILTDPVTGLEGQLDRQAAGLNEILVVDPELEEAFAALRAQEREYFILRQPESMSFVYDEIATLRSTIEQSVMLPSTERNQALTSLDIYFAIAEDIAEVDAQIRELRAEFDRSQESLDAVSSELLGSVEQELAAIRLEAEQISRRARVVNLLVLIGGIALILALLWTLQFSFSDRVLAVTTTAQAYQSRQFTTRTNIVGQDELAQLANTMNDMAAEIASLLQNLEQRNKEIEMANGQLSDELTVRRAMEQTLLANQDELGRYALELERSNSELEDFAYVVSHDLRAPLRGIGSLSQWLSEDYAEAINEEGQEMLRLLGQRIKRMQSLIDGILQYSRVSRQENVIELVSLAELVKQVVENLEVPNHIIVALQPGLPEVKGSAVQLTQMFQNLIDNAIKHMDKPAGKVNINWTRSGPNYEVTVADNGPGIAPKYHQKVFQIFQTLDTMESSESTGIGLSLVKKIVTLHGGDVRLASELGKGTKFIISLPIPEFESN